MTWEIHQGDALAQLRDLPADSVHCCITSPPYWNLRDYGVEGQLGQEATLQEYIDNLADVFAEVGRVLRPDGTLWLNLGDTFSANRSSQAVDNKHRDVGNNLRMKAPSGLPPKNLIGIPWRVAFALQDAGWILRSDIIWHKPNPMPESAADRPTGAHEYLFLLAQQGKYYYDADAIKEKSTRHSFGGSLGAKSGAGNNRKDGGRANILGDGHRNKRTVWTVTPQPYSGAHFATFPYKLIEPCILAGCPLGGIVLDPFAGAGTTMLVADRLGRNSIGIELNPEYIQMAHERIEEDAPLFTRAAV